jgi:hypothetical protein
VKDPLSQLAQVEVHSLDTGNLTDIDQKDTMWLIAFYATAGAKVACTQDGHSGCLSWRNRSKLCAAACAAT